MNLKIVIIILFLLISGVIIYYFSGDDFFLFRILGLELPNSHINSLVRYYVPDLCWVISFALLIKSLYNKFYYWLVGFVFSDLYFRVAIPVP